MWWETALSCPKTSRIERIFSGAVMRNVRLPAAPSGGTWSNESENARRKSFGRRWAKASFAVMMRISRRPNVWQYKSTP